METKIETSRDAIARGRLVISQPKRGYRFNIDSVILAGFASPPGERVCDLGTGSGIVGLWLATEGARVTGIEIQAELAELARINARENGLERRFEVIHGDLREFQLGPRDQGFDHVVSNPPFAPLGRGRIDSDPMRAIARHELHLRLGDLFVVARRLLLPGGSFDLVHRAEREGELLDEAAGQGLSPRRLRRVLPREGEPPSRVLLEVVRPSDEGADVDLIVESPLILHDERGVYTAEVLRLLGD